MDNKFIANILREIGEILEIQGENRFKILSYNRAADILENYPYDLEEIVERDPKLLLEIPGIGDSIAEKIEELVLRGEIKFHQQLLKKFNHKLLELLNIRGIGPKKVRLFSVQLGIEDIEQLEAAAKSGALATLPKMGKKSESEILEAINEYKQHKLRYLLPYGLQTAEKYIAYLSKSPDIKKVEYAGSLRRRKETVGDIDILTTGKNKNKIMDYLCSFPGVTKVLAKGSTKSSVLDETGIQIDLRIVESDEYGSALQYFTGCKDHNVAMREIAKKRGYKISEYGVFKKEKKVAGKTEEEVYKIMGYPYIEPELRENRGEFEAARAGKLPKLIEYKDLKGDLHMHSVWSDGSQSIIEIVKQAKKLGFKYIAISDHSQSLRVAKGLDENSILVQIEEIQRLREKEKDILILTGAEVDILENGDLDFSNKILSKLDIVIGSVHSKFRLPRDEQTKRVIKALNNPYLKILGHPSGRLLLKREPLQLDMEAIIKEAAKNKKILEINSNPQRLDLNDYYIKMAKDMNVKFAINSDSHHTDQFAYLKFGIFQARRGWLEKTDVINTSNDILKAFKT
ncbi:MAG: polymerase IV, family X protein [Candidatus Peregrinibacteria bacterium GW2011_GWA2_33_10]|nr:MAG: polymerase IV, family X protein [Candidatus Peregrinibacteria bacterium GW2011_GWA2_33_10]KKP41078.1 MAG: family X DNA polymerase IV, DNA polymerase (family X) [Candidatus Peregrinibacteria bacterium GW2011_GWC2_33_13]OGJ50740.1 MAG: hypothetical protein A2229_02695 [Candidatus Peregrinibacteria bacterium RIFOXYA2_FULL_33_7]